MGDRLLKAMRANRANTIANEWKKATDVNVEQKSKPSTFADAVIAKYRLEKLKIKWQPKDKACLVNLREGSWLTPGETVTLIKKDSPQDRLAEDPAWEADV